MSKKKNITNKKAEQKQANKKIPIIIVSGIIIIAIAATIIFMANRPSGRLIERVQVEEQELDYETKAERLFQKMKLKMSEPVSPYKFVVKSINKVEEYTWKVLDEDTTNTVAWERLAYVNSHFHGKQALLRYESYKNQGIPEKVEEEEKNAIMFFAKANLYYAKALEFGSADSANVYYMMSEAAEFQHLYDYSAINLKKAIELAPDKRIYQSKIIEAYLKGGRYDFALKQIENYKTTHPESDVPYVHLAGYYYNVGDTLDAIKNYEIAIEKGTKPEVGKFLHHYYQQHGNDEKANFYLEKAYEAQSNYNPDQY
jgi:tetratricopeptide (TPR) repeat protein